MSRICEWTSTRPRADVLHDVPAFTRTPKSCFCPGCCRRTSVPSREGDAKPYVMPDPARGGTPEATFLRRAALVVGEARVAEPVWKSPESFLFAPIDSTKTIHPHSALGLLPPLSSPPLSHLPSTHLAVGPSVHTAHPPPTHTRLLSALCSPLAAPYPRLHRVLCCPRLTDRRETTGVLPLATPSIGLQHRRPPCPLSPGTPGREQS